MSLSDCNDPEGVVLEAEGELFTVGLVRLVQGLAVFSDMFALGAGAAKAGGGGSDAPIPTGDEAAALRDFVWALRLRPGEVMTFVQGRPSPEKALKLINIARIAHKYQDFDLWDWAMQQLLETVSGYSVLTIVVLKPLLAALKLFDEEDATVSKIMTCLRFFVATAVPSALGSHSGRLTDNDLIAIVEACLASGCTSLLYITYYALLVRGDPLHWLENPGIPEVAQLQLLRGAYRLSEEWYRLRSRCPSHISLYVHNALREAPRPTALFAMLKAAGPACFTDSIGASHVDSRGNPISRAVYDEIAAWKGEADALLDNFPDNLRNYFESCTPNDDVYPKRVEEPARVLALM